MEGDVRGDERAALGRALDAESAVQDGEPVTQSQKTAPVRPDAAHAVVANGDLKRVVHDVRADRGAASAGVLCDVGQRLCDDEVSGRLDRGMEPNRSWPGFALAAAISAPTVARRVVSHATST